MVGFPRAMRVAVFALAACIALMSVSSLVSVPASAGLGPLPVSGYVKDDAGRVMEGVPVVVACKNGSTTTSTLSTTTDVYGFYTVTFAYNVWELGYNLIATATYGSEQVTENITITQEWGEQIDLQFPFEIPQFGTVLGFLAVAAMVGVLAIFLLPRRSKSPKQ